VHTSETKKIQLRQAMRLDEINSLKREGFLGESNNGYLVLRGSPSPLKQKRIKSLLKEENEDREELYKEVLKANNQPSSKMKLIEDSFSRSFTSNSPSGSWEQNEDGSWSKKP